MKGEKKEKKPKRDKKPKPGSVMRLLWRSHPWLTFFTLITGIISGIASIAVVSVINKAIQELMKLIAARALGDIVATDFSLAEAVRAMECGA